MTIWRTPRDVSHSLEAYPRLGTTAIVDKTCFRKIIKHFYGLAYTGAEYLLLRPPHRCPAQSPLATCGKWQFNMSNDFKYFRIRMFWGINQIFKNFKQILHFLSPKRQVK